MGRYSDSGWSPYVPVAQRRRQAARKVAKLKKAGRDISPIEIVGRKIATTFWGNAWCKNLESYSDYSNRLPRGRTYVRNGSVVDLQIEAGRVHALVSGSEMYEVAIAIKPLVKQRWTQVKKQCAGQIDSLIELLQGSISKGVMEIVTRKGEGLFPSPGEISLDCSCPDWATMCKHVAATLYGVGARLDHGPELLFTLRGVDPAEMVEAAVDQPPPGGKARKGRVLGADDLASVFGVDIEMDEGLAAASIAAPVEKAATKKAATRKKTTTTKKSAPKRASGSATRRAKNATTAKDTAAGKKPVAGKSATQQKGKTAGPTKTLAEEPSWEKELSSRRATRASKRRSARRMSG